MVEPRPASPPIQLPPLPDDFAAALAASPAAKARFDAMPPSHRREYLRVIEEAKRPETRRSRIEKSIARLAAEAEARAAKTNVSMKPGARRGT